MRFGRRRVLPRFGLGAVFEHSILHGNAKAKQKVGGISARSGSYQNRRF
jgi:hypothetical protein